MQSIRPPMRVERILPPRAGVGGADHLIEKGGARAVNDGVAQT